ncbi:MAG: uncharacterized membrane protein YkvA (DUF1232 family) [Gammaproteobacteria bacterium]|jgi:uncharacterized membrane protein YkvA (DUF1232 family)
MTNNKFAKEFTEGHFWNKVKSYARVAGKTVLEPALTLYNASKDAATPAWAKTAIYAALGYFISPIDAIPDLTPLIGYSDDLGVLVAATAAIVNHIKKEHKDNAKQTLKQWFD